LVAAVAENLVSAWRIDHGRAMSDDRPLPAAVLPAMPDRRERAPQRMDALVVAAPALFLLIGVALRYAAYVSINPIASPQGFADAMCVWDCYWYGEVAQHGYQAYPEVLNFGGPGGIANWAFFPLYPMLLSLAGRLLPFLNPAALGAIVSPLLTFAAVFAAWPLFEGNRRGYFLFGALLLAGPFSFYFATAYSESLFLLLTVLAFASLRRDNYGGAGIAGALLSATRTVGVLFVLSVLTQIALTLWPPAKRPPPLLKTLLGRPDMIFALVAVPLGVLAFTLWLHFVTGDSLAFVHIQRGWDRELVNPFQALWDGFTATGDRLQDQKWLALAAVIGLALCGALFATKRYAEAIFCALSLLLALGNGVESMVRFVAALAPLNLVAAELLARKRSLFWLVLLASMALDYVLTQQWLHQHGALM
jgi:hypothetical protein